MNNLTTASIFHGHSDTELVFMPSRFVVTKETKHFIIQEREVSYSSQNRAPKIGRQRRRLQPLLLIVEGLKERVPPFPGGTSSYLTILPHLWTRAIIKVDQNNIPISNTR